MMSSTRSVHQQHVAVVLACLFFFSFACAAAAANDNDVAAEQQQQQQRDDGGDDLYALDDDYVVDERMLKIVHNLPKPFALFSMICSYAMIREVVTDQRTGSGTPISRILFSIAVADIFFSFAWFLGAWPFPSYSLFGGNGSIPFCTFQGVLKMFGLAASVMFNASLSVFFLLMVRYKWPDRKLRKIEPWMQGCIWFVSLVLALYPIPLELYNPDWDICSVQSHPIDCSGDDCLRGQDPAPHQMLFAVLPWGCLGLSLISMGMILCSVRKLENQNSKYATSMTATAAAPPPPSNLSTSKIGAASSSLIQSLRRSQDKNNLRFSEGARRGVEQDNVKASLTSQTQVSHQVNRRNSKAVVVQAVCYTLAFLVTYMLEFIAAMWYITTNNYNPVLDYFTYGVFFVSAGTFNFLVFSRTRVRMKTCEGRTLRTILCCTCSWCPCDRRRCGNSNNRDGNNTNSKKVSGKTTTRLTSADDSTNHPTVVEEAVTGIANSGIDDDAQDDTEQPTAVIIHETNNNSGGSTYVVESMTGSGDKGNKQPNEKGVAAVETFADRGNLLPEVDGAKVTTPESTTVAAGGEREGECYA